MPAGFVPIRLPTICVPLTEPPVSSIPAVTLPEMTLAARRRAADRCCRAAADEHSDVSSRARVWPVESVPIKLPIRTFPDAPAPVICTPAVLLRLMTLPAPRGVPPIVFRRCSSPRRPRCRDWHRGIRAEEVAEQEVACGTGAGELTAQPCC